MAERRVGILVVSDTRSSGEREDETTAILQGTLDAAGGYAVAERALVADERAEIEAALTRLADEVGCALVLTTGGTGLARRDVTPEATRAVAPLDVPGLAEAIRVRTSETFPRAWLSRGVAALRGDCLIVNLPGSPGGVRDAMGVLSDLLPHALAVRAGEAHGGDTRPAAQSAAPAPPSGVPSVGPAPGAPGGEDA